MLKKEVKIVRPIVVDHIARIEGKAGIEVVMREDGKAVARVNVIEGPRFFESIVRGKHVNEAVTVLSRICSFCSAAHKLTAVMCAEKALGIEVSEQVAKLRELLYLANHIESHSLHLFFLVFPDLLGYHDVIEMGKDYPDVLSAALKLKEVSARVQDIIGSRFIHAENVIPGGFSKLPSKEKLKEIAREYEEIEKLAEIPMEILMSFEYPDYLNRDRIHIAVKPYGEEYTVIGKDIETNDNDTFNPENYKDVLKEKVVSHSFAKHVFYKGKRFMTGAISRYTIFKNLMIGKAREKAVLRSSLLDPRNPFSNNFAQAVELMYFIDKSKRLAEELAESIKDERPATPSKRSGNAIVCTEAPRGTLIYSMKIKNGTVVDADIITPTAMFLALMEEDIRIAAEHMWKDGEKNAEEISRKLQMLVRAYDPCISCSVHICHVRE